MSARRHYYRAILRMVCSALLTAAADQQCQTLHEQLDGALSSSNEYERMYTETERLTGDDLSLLVISSSSIHGRGVMLTRPATKDSPIGTLYYEVVEEIEGYLNPSVEGYWHARGFITDGGTIYIERMPIREALIKCSELPDCQGITFRDPEKLFADPHSELPSTIVDVEFKDKVHFGEENSWQSFLSHAQGLAAMYFPLGCSSFSLPNPPPASLDPMLMLPCWPRYVNHSCHPTAVLVKVPVREGFQIPGAPWKKVTYAYQVVALRDLDAGDEIALNYEVLPNYMVRSVEGVKACDKSEVS